MILFVDLQGVKVQKKDIIAQWWQEHHIGRQLHWLEHLSDGYLSGYIALQWWFGHIGEQLRTCRFPRG